MTTQTFDIAIAGGGLAGTLTAAFVHRKNPSLRLALIGPDTSRPSQTWSFHTQDLSSDAYDFLAPLISRTWPGYRVSFPDHSRRLALPYNTIRAHDYWQRIETFLAGVDRIKDVVQELTGTSVRLGSGEVVTARQVLDARGLFAGGFSNAGWQKFVGIEIETGQPHGISEPVIMDATVAQRDGYRFFYLLPYSATRLLIEDTYYSDHPGLNTETVVQEIRRYLQRLSIGSYTVSEQETGALPIPLDTSWLDNNARHPDAERIGMKGGFFHPTTGYSFPFVVRCAEDIAAACTTGNVGSLPAVIRNSRNELARSSRFLVRLNRMLFRAGRPEHRWKILSQFYRRGETVISGFYSGRLSFVTTLSMVTGIPPVPVLSGIRHFMTDQHSTHRTGEPQHG